MKCHVVLISLRDFLSKKPAKLSVSFLEIKARIVFRSFNACLFGHSLCFRFHLRPGILFRLLSLSSLSARVWKDHTLDQSSQSSTKDACDEGNGSKRTESSYRRKPSFRDAHHDTHSSLSRSRMTGHRCFTFSSTIRIISSLVRFVNFILSKLLFLCISSLYIPVFARSLTFPQVCLRHFSHLCFLSSR